MAKTDKCLNPNCDRVTRSRGLCNSCYVAAGNYVRSGRTTWAKLEKAGRVKPARKRSVVTAWLLEK